MRKRKRRGRRINLHAAGPVLFPCIYAPFSEWDLPRSCLMESPSLLSLGSKHREEMTEAHELSLADKMHLFPLKCEHF